MQRANDGPINRSTSTDTTSTTSGLGSNAKKALTLEEREAAYALARERIIGPAVDDPPSDAQKTATFSSSSSMPSSAAVSEPRQEDDTISRPTMEPIYPSLSHPSRQETLPIPDRQQLPPIFPPYAYSDGNHFFPPPPPPTHNLPQQGYAGQPYPSQLGPLPYGGQPYEPPQPSYMSTQAYNPQGWSQFPGQPMMPDPSQSLPVPAQGWVYLNTNGQPPIPQRMPMIPQGVPAYHQPYAYPAPAQAVQQNNYPQLAHPAPQRPPIHPHSSASSSISSMSYQDWSRPHSRGSTTSTRSATSSIRLGQRYQVGPSQPGFGRQKPPKTQGINGLTSLGLGDSRRSTRGHSPVSLQHQTLTRNADKSPLQRPPPQDLLGVPDPYPSLCPLRVNIPCLNDQTGLPRMSHTILHLCRSLDSLAIPVRMASTRPTFPHCRWPSEVELKPSLCRWKG